MLLKTVHAPDVLLLPRKIYGGRPINWFGGAIQVIPCPEAEDVIFLQKRCPTFPLALQPFVAAGVARACAASLLSGKRICSVALEPE